MIINKVLGGGGLSAQTPFTSVSTSAFPTAFVPTALNYTSNRWVFCGRNSSNSAVVGYVKDGTLASTEVSRQFSPTGIVYTSSRYIILSLAQGASYPAFYTQTALESLTSTTALTALTKSTWAPSSYGEDIISYQNKCSITGRSGSGGTIYSVAFFSSAVPEFSVVNYNVFTANGGHPIKICLHGTKTLTINAVGYIQLRNSLDTSSVGITTQVAGTISGITTSRVASFNNNIIVAGSKSDGTYIWYKNGDFTQGEVFTEKKIDNNVGEIVGISYIGRRYVVAYTYQGSLYFWVSGLDDLSTSSFIAHPATELNGIASDTFVDMKGNGTETYLISYSSANEAHATRLT